MKSLRIEEISALIKEQIKQYKNTIETENPKIMRAKVREYTKDEVNENISDLETIIDTCDDYKIVAKMKKIVPEFKSNNSVYTALDHQ